MSAIRDVCLDEPTNDRVHVTRVQERVTDYDSFCILKHRPARSGRVGE